MDEFKEFYDKIHHPAHVDKPVNYELLAKMIEYNIEDKKDWMLFWRK